MRMEPRLSKIQVHPSFEKMAKSRIHVGFKIKSGLNLTPFRQYARAAEGKGYHR